MEGVRAGVTIGGVSVRLPTPDDAASVQTILAEAPTPRDVTVEQLRAQFAEPIKTDGTGQWVVHDGEQVIGWVSLEKPQDNVGGLEVSIYLERGSVNQGLGTSLCEEFLVPAAKEAGVARLTATPHSMAAERLLKKCKFTQRGATQPRDPTLARLGVETSAAPPIWDRPLD